MLFNSLEFSIFLPIVFLLYWFVAVKNYKQQNIILLISSYVFYGWWDWRFLLLLLTLSVINYFTGILIETRQGKKSGKVYFLVGLLINIGVLAIFKYFNFFIDSFIDLVSLFSYELPESTTKIVLPIGISFYTFLSISYLIDVRKGILRATRNLSDLLLSLSFFPIILAGPIQRPSTLLPQFAQKRHFDKNQALDGIKQILWGLFAKVVIADKLAPFADRIFLNYTEHSGSTLAVGAILFTVQIYADFSGYSNIAIGVAKLFGFNLMQNFAYPYFSRDITEFWKRWHISLTIWFRDYVFLPISFSIAWKLRSDRVLHIKADQFIYIIASSITWLLTGFWHGANYTFIAWGGLNGLFLILYNIQRKPRKTLFKKYGISNGNKVIVSIETILTLFFIITCWVIFKSISVKEGFFYLRIMFSSSLFTFPDLLNFGILISICIFFLIEWIGKEGLYPLSQIGVKWNRYLRWTFYSALVAAVIIFAGTEQQFIYFQF